MKQTLELFTQTIESQLSLYTQMLVLLRKERDALAAQDTAAVNAVLAEKEAVLTALSQTNETRRECVAFFAAAFDVTEKDVTLSYLASVSAEKYATAFSAYADAFGKVVADVAELNFRNALLVKKMFARTKELSGLIRRAGRPSPQLYGETGRVDDAVKPLCTGVA